MATFDVYLQKAGDPSSAKMEQVQADIIGEAWDVARATYYKPYGDPDWTAYQIVRIEPEGETASRAAAASGLPLFPNPGPGTTGDGAFQGQPGYVAPQGLSEIAQLERSKASGVKGPMEDTNAKTETTIKKN
jgi:hypothetical protein